MTSPDSPTRTPATAGPVASSKATSSAGAAYAAQARSHWSRWRPTELASMTDPDAFFADLGQQAPEQVEELTDDLAGQDVPGEGYLDRLGRLRMARFTAQAQVVRELLLPAPESRGQDGEPTSPSRPGSSTDPDEGWLPTVLTPEPPRYHELDADPGLQRV